MDDVEVTQCVRGGARPYHYSPFVSQKQKVAALDAAQMTAGKPFGRGRTPNRMRVVMRRQAEGLPGAGHSLRKPDS
jgi:hypothetical protein